MNPRALLVDGDQPIYRQIAAQLRAEIVSGALQSEDQVMSTNQYAAFHRINPATVAKGFQELVDEGLLYKRRGVGMFVSPGARDRLLVERRACFRVEQLQPAIEEARRLGMSDDEVLAEVRAALATSAAGTNGAPR
jgi:DNA-binding transcriptional regulator YhcF (GntR family)